MPSVRIVADSGCDLPSSLLAQYEITVVPCLIRFGQDTVPDLDLGTEGFWERARAAGTPPATAAPPPNVFHGAFAPLVSAGHDVICLTLPGKHSATFNSAWLAAQEFGGRVRVIDSLSISLGIGFQVLEAAKAAVAGQNADAVQRLVESIRSRTSVIFVLDTLEWVRRGGRLDHVMPLIDRVARTFRVKPIMEMIDGDLRLLGVTRSYQSAITRLEEEVRARLPVEILGTAYTRGREVAVELAQRLESLVRLPAGVMILEAGPVFATHTGPNALGAVVVRA